ncbi:pilus assembly protein [Exilibacterium tricleocarpae]|uniref:Pilus assembly protein n=1 Tax=Exilibacterium tricleocarpae TaxID=2591008 RepID=A0A545TVQ0_9GAMM|nr:pilus assembly protein [Exilibacterium tricleocarpae]TQV81295.1 pilus assembly protein [Exilibacterium tricleocarpae]
MRQTETVNLTSLNLVRDELVATIESAASKLEQFVSDRENGELLQACIEGIQQITGTLNLIQLQGADLLAKELLALANEITLGTEDDIDEQLSVMTSSFFILPRYLEYAQQTRRGLPVLLISPINDLRRVRGAPPLPESQFFQVGTNVERRSANRSSSVFGEDLEALSRRLRHMYQVGLVGALQEKQVKASLGMMQRAVERLDAITGDRPLGKLWWVAAVALQVLANEGLELTLSRKMLFGRVDRQIKKVQKSGQAALDVEPNASLLTELVYLSALAANDDPAVRQVRDAFKYTPLPYTGAELARERQAMQGPSASTVSSVAAVLKDELRSTKEILELASQGGTATVSEFEELIKTLKKVADILAVVGLAVPSQTLKQEITKVEGWRDAGETADAKAMLDVADTLLYVESTVSGLDQLNLSDDKLSQANEMARKQVIASNQLAEAEMVVIQEAEAGLSLVKRALNSFAESNYDRGHIKNVAATLNAVRGGMVVMDFQRAGGVVASCVRFIEESLMVNDKPAALQQLLETFADAVISLEYYLDAVKTDKQADDSVLEVAEESLAALGHKVR